MESLQAGKHLSIKILIGMGLGALLGLLMYYFDGDIKHTKELLAQPDQAVPMLQYVISQIHNVFQVLGALFINALRMMVVPLVLVSLICGASSLSEPSRLGRLGGKTILLYLFTTAIAITLALTIASTIQFDVDPGAFQATGPALQQAPSVAEVILDLVPTNPIQALAEGKMLSIIVFAILFGLALSRAGEPGQRLIKFFNDTNDVLMKLVILILQLAPYGVFFLIATQFATMGLKVIWLLKEYFFTVFFILILHCLLVYPLLLKLLANLSPIVFLKKMRTNILFAFSTSSSSATLPVTLETVRDKLGVKNTTASFTVPLGATINMDGTAIMQGVATVFIAQFVGMELTMTHYLTIIMMATLASIGTAGVPSVGIIMLTMVLSQVGLHSPEAIGLIFAVDRLLDMTRTAVNVTGDATVTCIVAKSENELNEDRFYDRDLPVSTETKT